MFSRLKHIQETDNTMIEERLRSLMISGLSRDGGVRDAETASAIDLSPDDRRVLTPSVFLAERCYHVTISGCYSCKVPEWIFTHTEQCDALYWTRDDDGFWK